MVKEPTQDLDVPSKTIKEEEQEDFEEQEDCDNHDEHENEGKQQTTICFTLEQLEVLFKMNSVILLGWLRPSKEDFIKAQNLSLLSLEILTRFKIERL
jgi:hypothetical protein